MNTTSLFNDDIFENEFSFEELEINNKISKFMNIGYIDDIIEFVESKRSVIQLCIDSKDKEYRKTISECSRVAQNCFWSDEFDTEEIGIGDLYMKFLHDKGINYAEFGKVVRKYWEEIDGYCLRNFKSKYKSMNH